MYKEEKPAINFDGKKWYFKRLIDIRMSKNVKGLLTFKSFKWDFSNFFKDYWNSDLTGTIDFSSTTDFSSIAIIEQPSIPMSSNFSTGIGSESYPTTIGNGINLTMQDFIPEAETSE